MTPGSAWRVRTWKLGQDSYCPGFLGQDHYRHLGGSASLKLIQRLCVFPETSLRLWQLVEDRSCFFNLDLIKDNWITLPSTPVSAASSSVTVFITGVKYGSLRDAVSPRCLFIPYVVACIYQSRGQLLTLGFPSPKGLVELHGLRENPGVTPSQTKLGWPTCAWLCTFRTMLSAC